MTVDELIEELQKISDDGGGEKNIQLFYSYEGWSNDYTISVEDDLVLFWEKEK